MSGIVFEFRKTDSNKFYAPNRDLLHTAGPLLKASLGMTLDAFDEEEVSSEEFDRLVAAAALVKRRAMLKDAPEDIVADLFKAMEGEKPEVAGLFVCNFFRCFVLKYIEALRDCVEAPELTEDEIISSMRSLGVVSALPEDMQKKAKASLRAMGLLKATYAASTGMYQLIKEGDKAEADANDNANR